MARFSTTVDRAELVKSALCGNELRYHTGFGVFEFNTERVVEAMLDGETYFEEDGIRIYFDGSINVEDVEIRGRLQLLDDYQKNNKKS